MVSAKIGRAWEMNISNQKKRKLGAKPRQKNGQKKHERDGDER